MRASNLALIVIDLVQLWLVYGGVHQKLLLALFSFTRFDTCRYDHSAPEQQASYTRRRWQPDRYGNESHYCPGTIPLIVSTLLGPL
jgi:hypothetical protein